MAGLEPFAQSKMYDNYILITKDHESVTYKCQIDLLKIRFHV